MVKANWVLLTGRGGSAQRQQLVTTALESSETRGGLRPAEAQGRARRGLSSDTWCLAQQLAFLVGARGPAPLASRFGRLAEQFSAERKKCTVHTYRGLEIGQVGLTPSPGLSRF